MIFCSSTRLLCLAFVISGTTTYCSAAAVVNSDDVNAQTVARGIAQFSADFYKAAETTDGGKPRNWVFSPFSLSTAFAMLKVGLRGQTSSEVESAFHYPPSDTALASGFHAILQKLNSVQSSPNFNITSANRFYIDTQFQVLTSYQKILQTSFGSGIERLKLDPAAASVINKWVENVTHDKIQDLISPADLDPKLHPKFVLVNAIYFLGLWEHQFKKEDTRDQSFFLSEKPNDSVMVKMMHQDLSVQITYLKDIDADVFLLPYKGDRFFMVVFLPRTRNGLSKIESNLKTVPSLSQLQPLLKSSRFALAFPKFHIESTIDATKILPQLGVNLIFSDHGDFSGLAANSSQQLAVSKAIQKAAIIVDEQGTEAAAATAIIGVEITAIPTPPPDLIVDHPFYYQIVDKQNSGLILFAGSVTNPNKQS